jgi:hypothetical protein
MTISPLVKISQPVVAKDLSLKKRNPTIENFNFPDGLPTADDLPCSDGAPVDSELQELMPGVLKAILMDIASLACVSFNMLHAPRSSLLSFFNPISEE